jgi:hypothetical protein
MSAPERLSSDPLIRSDWDSSGWDERIRRALQEHLGAQLRHLFADLMEQPVPEHFLKLVRQWDEDWQTS